MEETDVEFDLAEDVEDCVCGVGVVGHGGGVDLVRWDEVVGGRHCIVWGGSCPTGPQSSISNSIVISTVITST